MSCLQSRAGFSVSWTEGKGWNNKCAAATSPLVQGSHGGQTGAKHQISTSSVLFLPQLRLFQGLSSARSTESFCTGRSIIVNVVLHQKSCPGHIHVSMSGAPRAAHARFKLSVQIALCSHIVLQPHYPIYSYFFPLKHLPCLWNG